ncbi:glycosyltransferase [Antarcticibacterium flavum]|uniref:Glycosyltransferase n=1 Tax=Antarcticibacterium flavum TaxID=2058175 RepID=A0A5B7X1P9_9FLAO|nr:MULTISPECIES: glycosyltransferase [Antarcticibacterium]MCM4158771.1 hypothetical protein [Antarcticibacterium sp. W02-3]QCY68622.1 glycosyltransferase [Antarcticibacterium flavum]
MKILHLIQKVQNRGAETFACQLATHQKAYGHEILVVSIYQGDADLPWKENIISLNASEKKRFLDFSAWKRLAKIVSSFQPHIIQANSGDTLKYVVLSKITFRWKGLIIFRNASEVGRYLRSPLQKKLNEVFYKKVAFVISVSRVSEKDILKNFPFLKGKTAVLPVGLENNYIINKKDLLPGNKKHILHIGGFTFEKNHFTLLKIFKEIRNKNPEVHLHLVGDGPLKKEILKKIHEQELEKYITLYGFVNDPLSFIEAADILVLPSLIEGLPGVLLEAMLCNTPVVAFNVGGVSEIVNDTTGSLVEKNNEVEFINAVLEILGQEKSKNDRIKKAREMVTKEYMNEKIASSFLTAYEELL